MRLITVGLGIAALLATSVAAAAPTGGSAGDKGNTGGKGGLGPEGSEQSGAGGTAEEGGTIDTTLVSQGKTGQQNADKTAHKVEEEKPWEIGGGFESHHLIMQNFLNTSAELQTFNIYSLYGRYAITPNDIASIGGGVEQFLQADQGEPGWRASDISLAYTHRFALPEKFTLATTGSLTIPISYYSQLASNITTPGITLSLSRKFGDLYVALSIRGSYFWDRYSSQNALGSGQDGSAAGQGAGQPNSEWAAGGALSAEYNMPFYRPLSVGAVVTDSYVWFYNVGQAPLQSQFYGATYNPTTDNNPFQQSYSDEIFVRYILPDLQGFKSDILLALANGDPGGLGGVSVLHDGIVHPYLLYYNSAEVYVAISGRY